MGWSIENSTEREQTNPKGTDNNVNAQRNPEITIGEDSTPVEKIIESFSQEDQNIITDLIEKKLILPENELLLRFANSEKKTDEERIREYLKRGIEIMKNPPSIEGRFSTIEKGFNQELVAQVLATLWYGIASSTTETDKESTWEIKKTSNKNDFDFLRDIINPNIDIVNRNEKTFLQEIKKYQALQYLKNEQQGQEDGIALVGDSESIKKRIETYWAWKLSEIQNRLFSNPDILQACQAFVNKEFQINLTGNYAPNTKEHIQQQEALEFLTSEYYQEVLVHITNKREGHAKSGKEIPLHEQINVKYIAQNMQYRHKAWLWKNEINQITNKEVKAEENARLNIATSLLRAKSDIIEKPQVKNAENKTVMIASLLKEKLEEPISDLTSPFNGRTYKAVCIDHRVLEFMESALINDIINDKERINKDNQQLQHDLTSLQLYAYLKLGTEDDKLANTIALGWGNSLDVQINDLITIITIHNKNTSEEEKQQLIAKLSNNGKELLKAYEVANTKQKTNFNKFCEGSWFKPPIHGYNPEAIKDRTTQRAKEEQERNQTVQEQISAGNLVEGKRVLAANTSVQEFLKQDINQQAVSETQQQINAKLKERFNNSRNIEAFHSFIAEHIVGELEELGLNTANLVQPDGKLDQRAVFLAFKEQRRKEGIQEKEEIPEEVLDAYAQQKTKEVMLHIDEIKKKLESSSQEREGFLNKMLGTQERMISRMHKQVKLEALGMVYDTLISYLTASPTTANFQLENIDKVEMKGRQMIINGHINHLPVSFAYNLDSWLISTNKAVDHQNETFHINRAEPTYPLFHLQNFDSLQLIWMDVLEAKRRELAEKMKKTWDNKETIAQTTEHREGNQGHIGEKLQEAKTGILSTLGEGYTPEHVHYQLASIQSNIEKDRVMTNLAKLIQKDPLKPGEDPLLKTFNIKNHPEAYQLLRIVNQSIHTASDAMLLNHNIQRLLQIVAHDKGWLVTNEHGEIAEGTPQLESGYKSKHLRFLFNREKVAQDHKRENLSTNSNNSIYFFLQHFTHNAESNEPRMLLTEMTQYLNSVERGEEKMHDNPESLLSARTHAQKGRIEEEKDKASADNLIDNERLTAHIEKYPNGEWNPPKSRGESDGFSDKSSNVPDIFTA